MNKNKNPYDQLTEGAFGLSAPFLSTAEYQQWRKEFSFNGIKTGARYGQEFCNHYKVTDYVLYYSFDPDRADELIKKYYIK
jgi:hypothetical protein